jgi:manganese/zinc/iron transport system permease protein
MVTANIEIILIASVVAVACALPGVFLVLRKMAMMSDAISHAILFGIAVAFLIVQDLSSPLLIVGAALTGVLTVYLVEALQNTRLVREDTAIGLVFPVLFSIGVILISYYARNVHLDTDAVLLGELAFAPFNRMVVNGVDIGPKSLYVMGAILGINVLFITLFYKELKITAFDPELAAAIGFSPVVIHYGLMTLVSLTAVGAFDSVGAVLVVALIVAPPVTAYLLTDRLSQMIIISAVVGLISAISGFWLAHWQDVNIAGSIATMCGVIFLVVYLFAPERGMVALAKKRLNQRWVFAEKMLAVHLLHHFGEPEEKRECRLETVHEHLRWEKLFAQRVARMSIKDGYVVLQNGLLKLTDSGKQFAEEAMVHH